MCWSAPPSASSRWCAMDHGIGILDTLSVGTAVLLDNSNYVVVGLLMRPVSLVLQQNLQRGDRNHSGLFDTSHGCVVGREAGPAGSVLNGIDLVTCGKGLK